MSRYLPIPIPHLNLVHRPAEVNTLQGFVDDAMTNGKNGLAGIGDTKPGDEVLSPRLHAFYRLNIVGPVFGVLGQGRDKLASETSPVAFAQKRTVTAVTSSCSWATMTATQRP